jgi:malto-oligosyltrehalose synthase
MRVPSSTYRLQLNSSFTFSDARDLVGYLRALGVGDLYSSPVLKACSGSIHCYDVIDHSVVNPELGGEDGLEDLAASLSESGLGLLLDIVPNHMSASLENSYWVDVLEYGRESPFSYLFDIDWEPPPPGPKGRVLLPILNSRPAEAVAAGEVRLAVGTGGRPFVVRVGAEELPVSSASYPALASQIRSLARTVEGRTFAEDLRRLHFETRSDFEEAKKFLAEELKGDASLRNFVEGALRRFPNVKSVLDAQNYALAHWRDADTRLNYRRFLSVNELVALRVEEIKVFDATHRVILDLLRMGRATGLRVDHADGLRDPALYFRRLKSRSGGRGRTGGVYVLAEKVLQAGKKLPKEWDVSGTTGYGFMNGLNGILVKAENAKRFDRIYADFTGETLAFSESVREGKRLAIENMRSELGRLAVLLSRPGYASPGLRRLKAAIRGVAVNFDGYRVYISPRSRSVRGSWRGRIVRAVAETRRRGADPGALRAIEAALLLRRRRNGAPAEKRSALEFVLRFQQFTAAVAVKGEEDTALYRYNRLVSLNEVGGDPSAFGESVVKFHRRCSDRLRAWPHTMTSTSTHDTKRSEDVRARIDVLSEMPDAWEAAIGRWRRLTAGHRGAVGGRPAPSRNDEYLFYQTLIGAWPHAGKGGRREFVERIVAYMRKATKEERRDTNWTSPSPDYDRAVERYVRRSLGGSSKNQFLEDFTKFHREIDWFGMLNSLSQTLIKLTVPGVPDVYQGNEVWDYSLVDPDNRRRVDFALRRAMLARLDSTLAGRGAAAAAGEALASMPSGMPKLYLTASVLRYRSANASLFRDGGYVPLLGAGPRRGNFCAFLRERGEESCVVCAPRFFSELCGEGRFPLGQRSWGGTRVALPPRHPSRYVNVLTGEEVRVYGRDAPSLAASEVFAHFPVALLRGP